MGFSALQCRSVRSVRLLARVLGIAGLTVAFAANASAQSINLSLNVLLNDVNDASSGGTWQVAAGSSGAGIQLVSFSLSGVNPGAMQLSPTGSTSGSPMAGFNLFSAVNVGPNLSITTGQFQESVSSGEAGAFYNVGVTAGGSPFASNGITVTGGAGIPWATGDTLGDSMFDDFALLASGTFSPGSLPDFAGLGTGAFLGSVYDSVGSATMVAPTSNVSSSSITGVVRSNFVLDPGTLGLPDYNDNGVVDAADYTIWRDTLGDDVFPTTGADGNGDGTITIADYTLWKDNFGQIVPPPAAISAIAIPEPTGLAIVTFAVSATGLFRRKNKGFSPAQGLFCKKQDYRKKLLDTKETPSHNASS